MNPFTVSLIIMLTYVGIKEAVLKIDSIETTRYQVVDKLMTIDKKHKNTKKLDKEWVKKIINK